jgi:type VI protein secretion system component VasK
MRKLFAFIARPIVWSTLGLGLLLLALYLVCDLFHLNDSRWLVELFVGGPLSLFLAIYWLRRYLKDRRIGRDLASQARKQAAIAGPDALRDFKSFEGEFRRAFGELNEACRKRGLSGGAAALPWIMVLGPPAVGKTTALDQSGLRFTSLGRRLHGIGPTRNCTWWLASDAIFLDTAGRYAVVDEDKQEWAAFLRLLQHRRANPLDAVVLQVGLDEILDRSPAEIERAALLIRERLDEISELLGVQTPIHILFNKCDLLDGFREFFADLTEDERRQPWGFVLDADSPRRMTLLSEQFNSGLDSLLLSLRARLSSRLLVQGDRASREAVLGFPDEVEALREPLRRFVETLFGAGGSAQHGEQPRLSAVYLASATQTAERRSGSRHRLGAELGVGGGVLRGTLTQISEGTFFLRGVFTHIIRQAEHAVRPSQQRLRRLRYEQKLATALTAVACAVAAWFLTASYQRDRVWLDTLQSEVAALREWPGVGPQAKRAEDAKIASELERETRVLRLLASSPNGALSEPYRLAGDMLRTRMNQQWLVPIGGQLQSDLQQATQATHHRPSEEFARGFMLLKAIAILQNRVATDVQCQQIKPDDVESSIGGYVLDEWRRALGPERHLLDPRQEVNEDEPSAAYGKLRAALQFFFAGGEGIAKATLKFDSQLVERARENLKPPEDKPTELVFLLRASTSTLYPKQSQLRTSRFVDPGIQQVYTMQGCDTFFDKKTAAGKQWWRCILNVEEPRDPVDLGEVYRQHYSEAWRDWLNGLKLSADPNKSADLLARTSDTLGSLLGPRNAELTQVVQQLGRGRSDSSLPAAMRRRTAVGCSGALGKKVKEIRKTYQDETLPEECKLAAAQVEPFRQLTAAKPKDSESEEDAVSIRAADLYSKYLDSGQKLRAALDGLRRMTPNKKTEAALELVQKTMGATGELRIFDEAREALIGDLSARTERTGLQVSASALHAILLQIESDIWQALLPPAAQRLENLWTTQVFDEWKNNKAKHLNYVTPDPEHCPAVVDFVNTKVKEFSKQILAPLYEGNNPASCVLTSMSVPFKASLPIDRDACEKVRAAIDIAGRTDCAKAMGAGGAAAKNKPKPTRADVIPPEPRQRCDHTAESAQLDDGEQLHTCGVSGGRCQHEPSPERRPRLLVKWANRASYDQYFEGKGDDYFNFLQRNAKISPTEIVFELPQTKAPGHCAGFRVTFQIPSTGGGGGVGGSGKPHEDWKKINLPSSLIQKAR